MNRSEDGSLREFLERRERELVDLIGELHSQLRPLESELAEVRRAKGAIGMELPPIRGSVNAVLEGATLTATATLIPGKASGSAVASARSPYENLTMKQLIVKALQEHFQNGATTRQLLEFFRDAWGRDIERQNLSPQISRLFRDGVIGRSADGHWVLYLGAGIYDPDLDDLP